MIHSGFLHRTWNENYNYFGDKYSDIIICTTAIRLHFIFFGVNRCWFFPPLLMDGRRRKKKCSSHPDFSKFRAHWLQTRDNIQLFSVKLLGESLPSNQIKWANVLSFQSSWKYREHMIELISYLEANSLALFSVPFEQYIQMNRELIWLLGSIFFLLPKLCFSWKGFHPLSWYKLL